MDPVATLLDIVLNPTVGAPLALLLVTAGLWSLRGRPRGRLTAGFEAVVPEPDCDAVSRTYVALRRQSYSAVVHQVYERLDRALFARCSLHMSQIPWRRSAALARGVPDPKGLEQSRLSLDALHLWAARLETDSLFRRDFWRTAEASRTVFLRRLSQRLTIVDGQLRSLTHVP